MKYTSYHGRRSPTHSEILAKEEVIRVHGPPPLLAAFDGDDLLCEIAVLNEVFPITALVTHHVGGLGRDSNRFWLCLPFAVSQVILAAVAVLRLLVLALLGNNDRECLQRGDVELMKN